jgi:hypothetical protein
MSGAGAPILGSGCHAGEEVVDVPAQIGGYISF